VARSRVLGAVAVGWLLTVPALALSLLVLAHPRLAFLRGNAVFLLVVGLIMVGVTELMRRANQLAIGTLLAAVVLSQVRAWRTLRG
jgi:bacteriorhodopsin